MNKRILSILLGLVLVASMLVLAVPVGATSTAQFTVTADKTSVQPSDTVTLTLTLGPVSDLGNFQAAFDIPSGLTYVSGSGALDSGAKQALGYNEDYTAEAEAVGASFDANNIHLNWVDSKKLVKGDNPYANSNTTSDIVLATIQCTVDSDASGTLTVGVTETEAYDGQTWDELGVNTTSVDITVTSGSPEETTAPTNAPTDAPTNAPTNAPTDAPTNAPTNAPTTAPTTAHTHNAYYVPQVDPTVDDFGVAEHFHCEGCGKNYADENCTIELTDDELRIDKLPPETQAPTQPETQPETQAPTQPETQPETQAPTQPVTEPETQAPTAPATEPGTEAGTEPATEPGTEPGTEAGTEAGTEPATVVAPTEGSTTPATGDQATPDQGTKDQATKDTTTKNTTSPKTGDSTHMYLWMLIMLVSLAGVCAVLFTAKRKGIFTK